MGFGEKGREIERERIQSGFVGIGFDFNDCGTKFGLLFFNLIIVFF